MFCETVTEDFTNFNPRPREGGATAAFGLFLAEHNYFNPRPREGGATA